jgi:TetR/AcrR family transcriptional repressor of nem operon
MRYKPDHKANTKQRILQAAAKGFMKNGIESTGISSLMSDLKLTHGGFYAHFPDKEALVVESVMVGLNANLDILLNLLVNEGIESMISYYVSPEHRDHPEMGCPLPSLSPEIGRISEPGRDKYTSEFKKILEQFSVYMPGNNSEQKIDNMLYLFASMAGAVALSRSITDKTLSDHILKISREKLISQYV